MIDGPCGDAAPRYDAAPGLGFERELMPRPGMLVAGLDEVGRGALAGPVTVGAVVVDADTGAPPVGLRDSKLVSARKREGLVDLIRAWAVTTALGHASPQEIDAFGIVSALGLAGRRALAGLAVVVDVVLLDGRHDYLGPDPAGPLDTAHAAGGVIPDVVPPTVHTRVKADRDCASVAAASVIAKVARDAMMCDYAERYPGYGWERNKGYGTATHAAAIRDYGHTELHRRSWRVPRAGK